MGVKSKIEVRNEPPSNPKRPCRATHFAQQGAIENQHPNRKARGVFQATANTLSDILHFRSTYRGEHFVSSDPDVLGFFPPIATQEPFAEFEIVRLLLYFLGTGIDEEEHVTAPLGDLFR